MKREDTDSYNNNPYVETEAYESPMYAFNPNEYIELLDDGFALCSNPMADGGLSAITVNTNLMGEGLRNFESNIKRMVLAKLFSPKFAEVILTATRLRVCAHDMA